jgi:acyl-lipid omega-6 desaturase (Delta-12 desaturase)
MGMNVLLQHTHPAVKWYLSDDEARDSGGQETRTVHVQLPRWYGVLGHEIMEHPAHHINPAIPFYRLHSAQTRLNEVLGADAVRTIFGRTSLRTVVRTCKLYDYDKHLWLDFEGLPTSALLGADTGGTSAPSISDVDASSPTRIRDSTPSKPSLPDGRRQTRRVRLG